MPSDRLEVNYESLERVATVFQNHSESTQQSMDSITQMMETLRSGWIGEAADAFFQEMEDEVLPTMRRLVGAIEEASQTTKRISSTMEDAEEQAGNCFR